MTDKLIVYQVSLIDGIGSETYFIDETLARKAITHTFNSKIVTFKTSATNAETDFYIDNKFSGDIFKIEVNKEICSVVPYVV